MYYSIGELSELAGVSARTLRYYDETGLLKPACVSDAGYRYYGERELGLLQQILFYRERGFELKEIGKILYDENFDIMRALNEHLQALEERRSYIDSVIRTVKKTIQSLKGEYEMKSEEKFQAFKEKIIRENEKKYGAEIRERYGDDQVDASNQKLLNMSEDEWKDFQQLGEEIAERLQNGVLEKTAPDSGEAEAIFVLHKKWLLRTWKEYTAEAHKALADSYTADERFRHYYDKKTPGCAELLKNIIHVWADRK